MKKKIIRVIFSIGVGFGLTILLVFGLMLLLAEVLKIDDETAFIITTLVMGTLTFAVLSGKVYDYLKRE